MRASRMWKTAGVSGRRLLGSVVAGINVSYISTVDIFNADIMRRIRKLVKRQPGPKNEGLQI
jgi:hypothetical protein